MFKNILLYPTRLGQQKIGTELTPLVMKGHIKSTHHIIRTVFLDEIKPIEIGLHKLYKRNASLTNPIINIGGDHSMSIATVQDSLNKYPNVKVLWIDAHADINTYESSCSKNVHGMPLSILTGLDPWSSMRFQDRLLPFTNLMYIGVRETDPFESTLIHRNNINMLSSANIMKNVDVTLDLIEDFIKDAPVHVSFDVDVLDPMYMPCTGTPVDNGMDINSIKNILDYLVTKNIVNMDITELNLQLGTDEQKYASIKTVKHLLEHYIQFK